MIAEMIQFNEQNLSIWWFNPRCNVYNTWCPVAQTCHPGGNITRPKNPRIIQVCGPETKSCVCFIYLSFGGYIHDIILLYDIHTYIHIYIIYMSHMLFNTYVPNLYRLISFSQGVLDQFFCF